ncbi:UDP-2,3-diacylglucosamine diphosphatase LpxI [Maricaulis sp.]|uniref:LpxI family protein n=1 Tax=Maricaulis sp. TaxID=1486257 RepID=UPI002623EC68|nr:UDP-2,3-diacylglucosamine diphosphatase LpxI [Maricaulis sp.]
MTDATPQAGNWSRLGILAGGGDLPLTLARAIAAENPFVVELSGFADRDYSGFETKAISVGQIGKIIKALHEANCDAVCFAGYVTRPDVKALKMDTRGLILVPKALAAGRKGDDALIRVVVGEFEQAGFRVAGADEVLAGLAPGADNAIAPELARSHQADIEKAAKIARSIGELDIGQACVVADGLVLAVEAQEGTNGMLDRVAGLDRALRGSTEKRRGVLAKMPKPEQERRVDLPTIGVGTVQRCSEAGLAGIVLEAGAALILEREAVNAAMAENGMFLAIVPPVGKAG